MQKLDINRNGINGWYCTTHNLYNDILDIECNYCNELRDSKLTTVAVKVQQRREGTMSETERELHADFFGKWSNEAAIAIENMDDFQLSAWISEMAKIALEAKVKTSYAREVERQRKAEKIKAGKPWLVPSGNEPDMQGVDTRQKRMSKLDKINALLAEVMSSDDAKELMTGNIKKVPDVKLGLFKTAEVKQPEVKEVKNDEPFDFSKLGD